MVDPITGPDEAELIRELTARRARIFSICLGYSGNFHTAEELAQDVFCRVLQNGREFRNAEHFDRWLFVVTRNLCRDHARKEKLRRLFSTRRPPEANEPESPESRVIRDERSRALKRAIDLLPEKYRAVLVLHEYGDVPYDRIAEVLKIPPGTVMSRLSRARRAVAGLAQSFLEESR